MNKKLLKSLFAAVLAFAGFFAISHYANAGVKGDVNGDGDVTASDVTCVYDILLGNSTEYEATADVNNDGYVTAADVTFIYDILLGNYVPEPDVYILGQVNGNTWGAATGVKMEYSEFEGIKMYTALVEFAGENDGYSYFSFTKKLAENNNDWDAIADQRFGSESDGFLIIGEQFETPLPLTYENPQAFKIAAGKYILEVNLEAMTLTVYPTMPPEPENVYILGEVNGNSWDPTVGVEMTSEDGKIFTADITTKESGYSYFGFTTRLADTANDWDGIAGYRFGAQGDGNFLVTEEVLNTEIPLTNENYQAIQIAPGTFNLSLDLENMKLTITGEFTPQEPPTSGGWYLIGTPNNWSSSDKSYPFVQDATNENVYSIHVDNVSGDFWFKIAAEGNYDLADFWSGDFLSAATDGESALSGNLVAGNQGAFCIPANYNCTYLDITIDVENLTYTITTDGQEPEVNPETADWYLVGTNNGWSTTDMSYPFVQDANNPNIYSIHVDNVSGDFWFKIAAGSNYSGSFWSGTFLSAATDGESALSGNLVQGNQGAFYIPGSYNCTYLDITIDVENLTYSISTDGQPAN